MTTTTAPLTRDSLTAGRVILTVRPDPTWRRSRELLGEEWHEEYTYLLERVPGDRYSLFLKTFTTDARHPDKPGRFVYTGVIDPFKGGLRLTRNSAFPASATRVKVADATLRAIFTGRAGDIAKHGWHAEAEIVEEDSGRFSC